MVTDFYTPVIAADLLRGTPPRGFHGRETQTMEKRNNPPMAGIEEESEKRGMVVYISGPYRAKTLYQIEQNIQKAKRHALDYWKKGYTVICPHMNTSFMDGELPDTVWLEGDLELVERSDIVVMIPGRENSEGAKTELQHAKAHGLDIIFA